MYLKIRLTRKISSLDGFSNDLDKNPILKPKSARIPNTLASNILLLPLLICMETSASTVSLLITIGVDTGLQSEKLNLSKIVLAKHSCFIYIPLPSINF